MELDQINLVNSKNSREVTGWNRPGSASLARLSSVFQAFQYRCAEVSGQYLENGQIYRRCAQLFVCTRACESVILVSDGEGRHSTPLCASEIIVMAVDVVVVLFFLSARS